MYRASMGCRRSSMRRHTKGTVPLMTIGIPHTPSPHPPYSPNKKLSQGQFIYYKGLKG